MSQPADNSEAQLIAMGWIANYPPWFAKHWIKPADCKTEEEGSQLLHLLRSIEDEKPKETQRLLKGLNPNVRLAGNGTETESLLEWAVQKSRNADCIRLLVAAGANVRIPNLVMKLVGRDNALLAEVLKTGADPNNGSRSQSALIAACLEAPDAVPLLLAAGADTNVTTTIYITDKKCVAKVTPLMAAAYAGHLQPVKLLLGAGVNVNSVDTAGNTAADWAKLARDKKEAAQIITLLGGDARGSVKATGTPPEPPDFAARAKAASYKKALALARSLTNSKGKPVELADHTIPGARAFSVHDENTARAIANELRPKMAALGAFAILSDLPYEKETLHLVLLPTIDYREAVSAYGTPEGQSINALDLIAWLEALEKTQPFTLTHLAPDRLRATFTTEIKKGAKLAKSIKTICPDVINAPLNEVASHLEMSRELYLWWD